MPNPSPTAQAIESIIERLRGACVEGMREPTAILTAEEHQILLELHVADPMAAGVVLQHVRQNARAMENWQERDVARISFRLYERGAQRAIRERERDESQANVVALNARRNARVRRARTHDISGDVVGTLSSAQMLETESTLLISMGLLNQHRDGRLWYDEFYKRTMMDWNGTDDGGMVEPLIVSDEQIGRVQQWLHIHDRRLTKLSMANVNHILDSVAYDRPKRNEPADWMRGLAWDGVSRLGDVFSQGFGARNTAFNREAGRCWFVSMVARACDPGCKVDTMPVFIGPQGIRKSQALECIGGKWYRAAASNIDSKDFLQELHGALVFEIQELHSILSSRLGAARAKAVLSTRVDHFRLPYGLRVGEHKRTCVICGTTNNRDWHSDDTGGRRYWPVHCGEIDLAWISGARAQLFAEALFYYEDARQVWADLNAPDREARMARGQWWNVPEGEQAELIDAETWESPWQETIATRVADTSGYYVGLPTQRPTRWDGTAGESTDWGNMLTVTRIGVAWLDMTREQLGRGSGAGKTISAIMRGLGWEMRQVRIPGSSERVRAFVLSHQTIAERERARLGGVHDERGDIDSDARDRRDNDDGNDEPPF